MLVKFLIRSITILMGMMALCLIVALAWGNQFNRFPDVVIQIWDINNDLQLYVLDNETHLSVPFDLASNPAAISPDGRYGIRYQWDGQLHIYLASPPQSEAHLLGSYDIGNSQSTPIAWAPDSQSLYIADMPFEEDMHLYQVDIATGELSLVSTYAFREQIWSMNFINEDYLVMWRNDKFLIINIHTSDSFIDANSIYPQLSSDGRYLAYGVWSDYNANASTEGTTLYVLDLQSKERVTLNTSLFDSALTFLARWSPTAPLLPLRDYEDNTSLLYNAETQSFRPFPDGYDFYSRNFAWSSDGTRLFVTRRLNDEEVMYSYWHIETGEVTDLFSYDTDIRNFSDMSLHGLRWSSDNRYILAVPARLSSDIAYTIYDTESNAIVYEYEQALDNRASSIGVFWYR